MSVMFIIILIVTQMNLARAFHQEGTVESNTKKYYPSSIDIVRLGGSENEKAAKDGEDGGSRCPGVKCMSAPAVIKERRCEPFFGDDIGRCCPIWNCYVTIVDDDKPEPEPVKAIADGSTKQSGHIEEPWPNYDDEEEAEGLFESEVDSDEDEEDSPPHNIKLREYVHEPAYQGKTFPPVDDYKAVYNV